MKFNIGDKVRIKDIEKQIKSDNFYSYNMIDFINKIGVIQTELNNIDNSYAVYFLKHDKIFYYKPDDMEIVKRGFEVVRDKFRKHPDKEIILPQRADKGSAGYDIRTPIRVEIKPNERVIIPTDIKAYMQEDEVLEIYVRSSIGIKKGLILSNTTGIIDSSYYYADNDGNIGLALFNTTNETVILEENERVCQGVFKKYLTIDNDECIHKQRTGGIGSSGTK